MLDLGEADGVPGKTSARGRRLFPTLSNAIRFYYVKNKTQHSICEKIGAKTKYLTWKRASGSPGEIRRATLSYFLRYQMRAGFTTLKPIRRFNMSENGAENQVLDLEES